MLQQCYGGLWRPGCLLPLLFSSNPVLSCLSPQGVKSVLQQCYGDRAAVTDELVELILTPGLQPGAVDVFLDFISYSSGPLPEELLEVNDLPPLLLFSLLVPLSVLLPNVDWRSYVAAPESLLTASSALCGLLRLLPTSWNWVCTAADGQWHCFDP